MSVLLGAALRRWWWVVVLGVILGVGAGVALQARISAQGHMSTSQVLVTGLFSNAELDSAYTSNQYVSQRMTTYAQIATSDAVTGAAASSIGTDPGALAEAVRARVEGSTTVVTLEVIGESPEIARRRASAVTTAFVSAITQLESPVGTQPRVQLDVITKPTLPEPSVLTRLTGLPLLFELVIVGALVGMVIAGSAVLTLRFVLRPEAEPEQGPPDHVHGSTDAPPPAPQPPAQQRAQQRAQQPAQQPAADRQRATPQQQPAQRQPTRPGQGQQASQQGQQRQQGQRGAPASAPTNGTHGAGDPDPTTQHAAWQE